MSLASKLFWRLPHDLRRVLFRLRHPETGAAWDRQREVVPDRPEEPSLKPCLGRRAIFVHIPKAAGISIGHGLFGRHTGNHLTIAEYKLAFPRREFDACFKFAFVRNPWDRLVSAYTFLANGGRNEQDRRWRDAHLARFAGFEEFVRGWVNEDNVHTALHFKPQHSFLVAPDRPCIAVDFVGYFENLDADYAAVRERIGGGEPLTVANPTAGRRADYRSCYTDATRDIVARAYRSEVEPATGRKPAPADG